MGTLLDRIFADNKEFVEDARRRVSLSEIRDKIQSSGPVRDIRRALTGGPPSRIIAELKHRTPFKGELRKDFDPVTISHVYAEHGAAAISVLTEPKYFGGSIDFLGRVRDEVKLPLLRKDFIFSDYQVFESRGFGADLFLLIATWLDRNHLADLLALGEEIGIPALVETHCEEDLEKAFEAGASLIGINNRDLKTGETDLDISCRLIPMASTVPETLLVCESGIHSRREIEELENLGAHAFLVGESLMTAGDIGEKLDALLGQS